MPGRTEAERSREEALQQTHISLQMAKKDLEDALDWSRSWPNKIKQLDQDLESMITRLGTIITAVKPPDYVTLPGGQVLDSGPGEAPIIRISGED